MSSSSPQLAGDPRWLRDGPAPHWHSGDTAAAADASWLIAVSVPAAAAVLNFGTSAISALAVAAAAALLAEAAINTILANRAAATGWESHALVTGLLAALSLPANAASQSIAIPLTAALAATLVGRVLSGGMGNYLWHPAAVGRIVVQIVFGSFVAVGAATQPAAVQRPSAVESLAAIAAGSDAFHETGRSPITVLVRDYLPPWSSTLLGTPADGLGPLFGGCTVALLVAVMLLAWRGHARLSCIGAGAAAAAITAFALPIPSGAGPTPLIWMPGRVLDEGLPVGLVYVLYQLTSGELMFVLLLLAADSVSSPLTSRGQRWFGAGIGALTIAFRQYGLAETAGFWALLVMNTLVPLIDRLTRRRVYGT